MSLRNIDTEVILRPDNIAKNGSANPQIDIYATISDRPPHHYEMSSSREMTKTLVNGATSINDSL